MERTQIALADKIREWELSAGESFTDYYMHDSVKDVSWAFWLLGKGFTERANELIDLIQAGETCIDQELLYEIYPQDITEGESSWDSDIHSANICLWAEFLVASDRYWKDITEWFADQND
jgi:hypothetical protein